MAYGNYGGYAYRNGKKVPERSDTIVEGFDKEIGQSHVVLGDGPVYLTLHRQGTFYILCGNEIVDPVDVLDSSDPDAIVEGRHTINYDYFCKTGKPMVFNVRGHRIEVMHTHEDNYYQYAKLELPDGNVWHGWSGYGVGAGFEDQDLGYSTTERDHMLCKLWPEAILKT